MREPRTICWVAFYSTCAILYSECWWLFYDCCIFLGATSFDYSFTRRFTCALCCRARRRQSFSFSDDDGQSSEAARKYEWLSYGWLLVLQSVAGGGSIRRKGPERQSVCQWRPPGLDEFKRHGFFSTSFLLTPPKCETMKYGILLNT